MFFKLTLLTLFTNVYSKQLYGVNKEPSWIAIIDDAADCDVVTDKINDLINEESTFRVLLESTIELKSDIDCFVEFEGVQLIVDKVLELEEVLDVEPNEEIFINEYVWNLDRADQNDLPLDKRNYNPTYTGIGTRLYVLDTGIYKEHNEFSSNRARYGDKDHTTDTKPGDLNGHGTHCAATAAGENFGIAPEAEITGIKVLSENGSGSTSGVIAGVQSTFKKSAGVISMSLGGSGSSLDKVVKDASKKHIVVVAAGNSNADACDYTPAGAGGKGDVITVGSTNINDMRSSFSSYGKCVDVWAPGSNILSAGIKSRTSTATMSGTSMATPYVAGIALQYMQKNNNDIKKARADLVASFIPNRISDVKNTHNVFAVAASYTGSPTPPTIKPTRPPTFGPPELCSGKKCFEFAQSTFGPQIDNMALNAEVLNVFPDEFCKYSKNKNMEGKIVALSRGNCLFFDKVKNAEKNGAIAVLIINDVNSQIVHPQYYGKLTTKIPSAMISKKNGLTIQNGEIINWGTPVATPTKQPTTGSVTKCSKYKRRRSCRRAKHCMWKKKFELEKRKCIQRE